ncbi:MAG: hypothetical protein JWO31_4004 [Phycisphaerales bacterium]|nr:hypothetical protein [Phycisphaerales bacterium]
MPPRRTVVRWALDLLAAAGTVVALTSALAAGASKVWPHESRSMPNQTSTRVLRFSDGSLDITDHVPTTTPGMAWLTLRTRFHLDFVTLLGLALPVPLAWVLDRWAGGGPRPNPGLCIGCGYDLRASPEHCPECGRPIADL